MAHQSNTLRLQRSASLRTWHAGRCVLGRRYHVWLLCAREWTCPSQDIRVARFVSQASECGLRGPTGAFQLFLFVCLSYLHLFREASSSDFVAKKSNHAFYDSGRVLVCKFLLCAQHSNFLCLLPLRACVCFYNFPNFLLLSLSQGFGSTFSTGALVTSSSLHRCMWVSYAANQSSTCCRVSAMCHRMHAMRPASACFAPPPWLHASA